jgi:hypothetical protein
MGMEYLLYMNFSDLSAVHREDLCNKGIDFVGTQLEELEGHGKTVRKVNTSEKAREGRLSDT